MKLKILTISTLLSGIAQASPVTPIYIGGNEYMDACPGTGQVVGLRKGGDEFLAVRTGPSTKHPFSDKLKEGQTFYVCSSSVDEKWVGIVYSADKTNDCGVTTAIKKSTPYRGKCKQGWIHSRWMNVIAG